MSFYWHTVRYHMRDTYRLNHSLHHKHLRRLKRRLLLTVACVLAVGAIAGGILYNNYAANRRDPAPTSRAIHSPGVAPTHTYRTAAFQFQDTATWVLSPGSTPNEYTFGEYDGKLIEHLLVVYVNQTPDELDLATARVLPVDIVNGTSLAPTTVSDPCSTAYGPHDLQQVRQLSFDQTSFLCDPEMVQYAVIVGQIGGTTTLNLTRSDGSTAHYIIIYKDVTVNPTPQPMLNALKSFHAT